MYPVTNESQKVTTDIIHLKITGIVKKLPFNNEGERLSLEEASRLKDLCFKNGKPAYWITDIDHGTGRLHGGTINSDLKVYKV